MGAWVNTREGALVWRTTGSRKTSLGCPVQGSRHIGCNTGSTGSGSGSTAATAAHTVRKNTLTPEISEWVISWSSNTFWNYYYYFF